MSEFEIIQTITRDHRCDDDSIWLGPGDDCAGVSSHHHDLVMTMDTLVAAQHFDTHMPADALGHKAAAVSLSDVAAMGAKPLWMLCALTVSQQDPQWMAAFCRGFHGLLEQHGVFCIGGDLTQGAICSVTTQCTGHVAAATALRRDGAQIDDDVYVSGDLGLSRYAYESVGQADQEVCPELLKAATQKLHWPQPRVALGQALLQMAHACLDISDGLVGDLTHICQASQVGIVLDATAIPVASLFKQCGWPTSQSLAMALYSGDEYELCWTAPSSVRTQVAALAEAHAVPITRIGRVVRGAEITWSSASHAFDGILPDLDPQLAWQHFSAKR